MKSFKELLRQDVKQTFLNIEEFSDLHEFNGRHIPVQIDDIEQIEREKRIDQHMDGIYTQQRLVYVSADDYGPLPAQGATVTFDGRRYFVTDAIDECGVYSITLEANRSRR